LVVDVRDVITCFKFGDDRFRGLASAEGQILPFPIDFDGCPYNTLTLPCERVISTFITSFYCIILLLFYSQIHFTYMCTHPCVLTSAVNERKMSFYVMLNYTIRYDTIPRA